MCRDRGRFTKSGDAAAILTMSDSICWLLNIRGSDITHNPVVQSYAILHATGAVDLFVDAAKLVDLGDHLGDQVRTHPVGGFLDRLATLSGQIRIDAQTLPKAAFDALHKASVTLRRDSDPTSLPKASKMTLNWPPRANAICATPVTCVNFCVGLTPKIPIRPPKSTWRSP